MKWEGHVERLDEVGGACGEIGCRQTNKEKEGRDREHCRKCVHNVTFEEENESITMMQ